MVINHLLNGMILQVGRGGRWSSLEPSEAQKKIPASSLWTFLFVEVVDSPFLREMMGCEEFANSQRLENVMIHQKLQVPRMEVLTYISCMKGLCKGIPTHKTACIILVPETFDDMMLVGLYGMCFHGFLYITPT